MKLFIIPLDIVGHPERNVRQVPILEFLAEKNILYGIERYPYFNTNNILLKILRFIKYSLKLLCYGLNKRRDIDLIFCQTIYFGFLGVVLCWLTGKPLIVDTLDGNVIEHCRLTSPSIALYRWISIIENIVGRTASKIVVLSEYDKQLYQNQNYKYISKLVVIPSGIDLKKIDRIKTDKNILRTRLMLEPTKKFLIFSGNMNYSLNMEAVVWINNYLAPRLADACPEAQIILTGAGAIKEQLHKNIIFLGYVDNYFEYVLASDIGLVPYEMDTGISTKLIDYLSCKLPTICMESVAKLFPQLQDGENIFIAEDKKDFIQKTLFALTNQDSAVTIGACGREIIENYYEIDHIGKLWLDTINSALKKKVV